MKNFRLIIAFSALFTPIFSVFAQSDTVELSRPVGGDILPGGTQPLTGDIKSAFVFSKLIPFVITYAIGLAVALAVIALIIGGYQYMTAYGDEEQAKNAQKTVTFAIIGLVLAITAFGIVKIITSLKIT